MDGKELDLRKVYVIGGIVDRSIVRGVTLKEAGRMGVRTARLPLEHLDVRGVGEDGRGPLPYAYGRVGGVSWLYMSLRSV